VSCGSSHQRLRWLLDGECSHLDADSCTDSPALDLSFGKVSVSIFLTHAITTLILHVAGLMNELALKVYDAMAFHVTQANMRRRIQTVSVWSLQQTVVALLATLRTLADPVRAQLQGVYGRLDDALSLEELLAAPDGVAPPLVDVDA
jgi:hypothetical protein